MALVLAVGGVADFFRERVIDMLERAHRWCMHADVQSLESIEIARRIEQSVDGLAVAALRFGQAEDGAVGFGGDARGVRRIVDELGGFAGELGVEFASEGLTGGSCYCSRAI